MFSQNPVEQKAQMEALANSIDDLIETNQPVTYRSAILPTQVALEAWWLALGNTLPIPPQREIYWHDTKIVRSLHSTMKDYYAPVQAQPAYRHSSKFEVRCTFLAPIDAQHSVYSGTVLPYTGSILTQVTKTVKLYLDGSATLIGTFTALDYDPINREIIYASSNNLRRIHIDTLVDTSLVAPVSPSGLYAVHQRPDGVVYYSDFNGILRQRAVGGTITTIVTLNTILTGTVYAIKYDSLTDKILLFYYNPANGHTGVMRINATGAITDTAMVALSAYGAGIADTHPASAGGGVATFYFHGFEVRAGILYVPEVGLTALNINTRRRIDIATNTVLGTETFDYGEAFPALEATVAEATALRDLDDVEVAKEFAFGAGGNNTTGNYRTQASRYYGVRHLSGLFTKLIDIQRLPDNGGWYLRNWTSWGPGPLLLTSAGHTLGNYWSTGVLPDSNISGKIYALTEYGDLKSDYVTLKTYIAEAATKEVVLDWSDLDMTDFGTIEIIFDSGLSGADTVSVQVNGNSSASYTQHLFRLSVAVNTYSTAASGTAWVLPSVAVVSTMSGRYQLIFPGQDLGNALAGQAEGSVFSGTTTGLINGVLGQLTHTLTDSLTSVRIFTTGGVQSFPAGARFSVQAYRTKARHNRSGAYYGPALV